MEFFPAPYRAPHRAFASLVFPWQGDLVLIAKICDRGWCIPSGRVEPGECSQRAAIREAREEAGAILGCTAYLGCYRMSTDDEVRWADVFVAEVESLAEITHVEESSDRKFVALTELPDCYHLWNPLTEAVFNHSYEVLQRLRALRS
jgi:8-oxo-dGTP diphosphatase